MRQSPIKNSHKPRSSDGKTDFSHIGSQVGDPKISSMDLWSHPHPTIAGPTRRRAGWGPILRLFKRTSKEMDERPPSPPCACHHVNAQNGTTAPPCVMHGGEEVNRSSDHTKLLAYICLTMITGARETKKLASILVLRSLESKPP